LEAARAVVAEYAAADLPLEALWLDADYSERIGEEGEEGSDRGKEEGIAAAAAVVGAAVCLSGGGEGEGRLTNVCLPLTI
jgi:hypothetical protein